MTRILGIDPGSQRTGVGIVDAGAGGACVHVHHEALHVANEEDFPRRLRAIVLGLDALIERFRPDEVSVERVFMSKNADSALKLGQARGAAICAAVLRDLPVHEYTPMQVKQSLVGRGAAEKGQVQHMVGVVLGIPGPIQADAADALAIAITHAHARGLAGQAGLLAAAMLKRRGTRR